MIFKNKHSFIAFFLCTALTALCSCTGDSDIVPTPGTGNSPATGTPLEVRTTVAPFRSPDASPATRATIDNVSTKFQNGDAIGLICFRSGATGNYISEDISNLKLVFSEANGVGTWKIEGGGDPIYYTDAVNYLAYYPYIQNVDLTSVTTVEAAKTAIENSTPDDIVVNQHKSYEIFSKADRMTAVSTLADIAGTKTLTLNFQHECVLLIVKPMGKARYSPPSGVTAYEYHPKAISNAWGIDKSLVEIDSPDGMYRMKLAETFYAYSMPDGSFATMIIPQYFEYYDKVKIEYTTNNGTLPVTVDATLSKTSDSYKAGCCHVIEVHHAGASGVGGDPRALKPGDFVLQQSNKIVIYPGDSPVAANGKIPDYADAIGIVVTSDPLRMTDSRCTSNGNSWTNAYVMGLENISDGNTAYKWANDKTLATPLSYTPMEEAESYMDGYTDSEKMLTQNLANFPIFEQLRNYRTTHPFPNSMKCSPWFIPSIGQWFDVMTNLCGTSPNNFASIEVWGVWMTNKPQANMMLATADSQLAKVGATFLMLPSPDIREIYFWLSSVGNRPSGEEAWSFRTSFTPISSTESDASIEVASLVKNASSGITTARLFFAF